MDKNGLKQSLSIRLWDCCNDTIDMVLWEVFSFFSFTKKIEWEIYHWSWTPKLFLKTLPVQTIENIYVSDGTEWTAVSWYTLVQDMWFIFYPLTFTRWYSNWKIDYTAWYDDVPGDLYQAIVQYVWFMEKQIESNGIKSEAIDDYSISFDKTIPQNIVDVFNKYRHIDV